MSRRTLPILLALLAAAGGTAWWVTRGDVPLPTTPSAGTEGASIEAIEPQLEPIELPSAAPLARATDPTLSTREAGPTRVAQTSEPTVWVEGRVIVPPGTPADERVDVIALSSERSIREPYRARMG